MTLEEILDQIQGFYDEGQVDQALEAIKKAAQISSRNEDSLGRLATYLAGADEFTSAREVLFKLVLIAPTVENNYQLANCCHLSGWTDHAILILDRLQDSGDELPVKVYKLHGDILYAQQDWSGAFERYSKASQSEPDDSDILAGFYKSFLKSENFDGPKEEQELLSKLAEIEPDNDAVKIRLEEIVSELAEKESKIQQEIENNKRRFSFWKDQEYDSDCGIPDERIPENFISVIIPVCNHEALLKPQIESLLEQNLPHGIEIIVVDYGSTQSEESIVTFFNDHKFPVRYQKSGSKNKIDACNTGAKIANGDYLLFVWPGETLRQDASVRFTKAIRSQDGIKVVYSDWARSSLPNDNFSNPNIIQKFRYEAHDARFLLRTPLAMGPALIDKDWLTELMYLHTDKSCPFHELILRTSIAGGGAISIPEILGLRYFNSQQELDNEISEINETRLSHIDDFPIEKIYNVDAENSNEIANAWLAYGNWMLEEVIAPGEKYASDEMELAIQCYRRALDFSPAHEGAIQNLVITSSALGQLESVLSFIDRLPARKKDQLLSDIGNYRRNFFKVEISLCSAGGEFRDEWTEKVSHLSGDKSGSLDESVHEYFDVDQANIYLSVPIRWVGTFFAGSNQSSVAIEWAQCLAGHKNVGICHTGTGYSRPFVHGLPKSLRHRLFSMSERYDSLDSGIAIYQNVNEQTRLLPDSDYHIGIADASSTQLSADVVRIYNQLDEVWVANSFLKDIFINAGVENRKINRMPIGIDDYFFKPDNIGEWKPAEVAEFQFLTIVDDPHRCGLDLAIQAFSDQFSGNDNAGLWIYINENSDDRAEKIELVYELISSFGEKAQSANIQIIDEEITWNELPSLINHAHAIALPYRFEVFGVEVARAVGCEKPVISTNHGGVGALSTNGNIELISYSSLHSSENSTNREGWVEPSLEELKQAMERVFDDCESFKPSTSAAAIELTNSHGQFVIKEILEDKLSQIEDKLINPTLEPIDLGYENDKEFSSEPESRNIDQPKESTVLFEGETEGQSSLARFNHQFTEQLDKHAHINVSHLSQDSGIKSTERSVLIRNQAVQKFSKPTHGRWVHMADWGLSRIPQDWVQRLEHVDEIWVTSEFQRRAYVDSGIEPSKLSLIPLGVDTEIFHPGALPMEIDSKKVFRFLYIGKGEWRGGADLLLGAFYETFKSKTNVELILVDTDLSEGQTSLRSLVSQFTSKLDAPSIKYMKGDFSDSEFASLYAACDSFVYPYRSESTGVRVIEAMASGLPVIVTGGGFTDDFVGDKVGYRVPSLRRWIGSHETQSKLVGKGYYLETDISALGAEMTHVLYHRRQATDVGRTASEWIVSNRQWDKCIKVAQDRIHFLSSKPVWKETETGRSENPTNTFWQGFEDLVDKGSIRDAWEYMCSAIQKNPFNPDACHGLLQLSSNHGWNRASQTIQNWMMKWLDNVVVEQCIEASHNNLPEKPTPDWLAIPEVISELDQLPKLTVAVEASSHDQNIHEAIQPLSSIAHQVILCGSEASPDVTLLDDVEAEWIKIDQNCSLHDQRNRIVSNASGDWILFLQAGESIDSSELNSLYKTMTLSGTIASSLPRITHYGESKQTREFALRLFRNVPGLHFTGNSYEHLSDDWDRLRERWDLSIAYEIVTLNAVKDPHSPLSEKENLRREELESLVARQPSNPRLRLNFAEELISLGLTRDAEEQYLEILQLLPYHQADSNTSAILENTFSNLAKLLFEKGQFDKVIDLFRHESIRIYGLTSSMHYIKGKALLGLEDVDGAIVEFTKANEKKLMDSYVLPFEEMKHTPLEERIQNVISDAGYPGIAKTWDKIAQSTRSAVSIDDDELPSEQDVLPLP